MDWYPLYNSLRIAAISCVLVFFAGIFAAYYVARLPRAVKGILDVILTLPMVLPPTVVGYFILLVFGAKRPLGIFLAQYGIKFVMTWYGGVLAAAVVAFPLMYRTARGAFESFDDTLAYSGQTLGLSNTYIFWHIRMPYCRQGILAGTVLAFARALGDMRGIQRYGSFYLPMDEALILCAVDLSGRCTLNWDVRCSTEKVGDFDVECAKEFWLGFARSVPATVHFVQFAGENTHHILEACFKGAGHALAAAVAIDAAHRDEIPSTKGLLV